jgi:hypothetical protein
LKSYNGFSGERRARAQYWLNTQWRSGAIARPFACIACGQTAQPIDAHAEDYSEPFRKDVTDAFHLCFVCHMRVHSRHRNQEAWRIYRDMVESGGRAIPVGGRNFPAFHQKFLTGKSCRICSSGLLSYSARRFARSSYRKTKQLSGGPHKVAESSLQTVALAKKRGPTPSRAQAPIARCGRRTRSRRPRNHRRQARYGPARWR